MAGRSVEILIAGRDATAPAFASVTQRLRALEGEAAGRFKTLRGVGEGFGQILSFATKLGAAVTGAAAGVQLLTGNFQGLETAIRQIPGAAPAIDLLSDSIARLVVESDRLVGGRIARLFGGERLRLVDPDAERKAAEAAKLAERQREQEERAAIERKARQHRETEAHRAALLELRGIESQIATTRLQAEGRALEAQLRQIADSYEDRITLARAANKLELAERLGVLRDAEIKAARIADLARREPDIGGPGEVERIHREGPAPGLSAVEGRFLRGVQAAGPSMVERNTTKLVQLTEKSNRLSERTAAEVSRLADVARGIIPATI